MKTWFIACILCVAGPYRVWGQDGKLTDQRPLRIPDSVITAFEKRYADPGLRDALGEVTIQTITYRSDGLNVKGVLAVPRQPGRYPCLIYNRGGNREFGAIGTVHATLLARFASWGYVVVASQYRGNAGGEGQEEFGGKDVNDVLNLIPLLADHPQADTARIGMYGWSRGGMMTYLALTRTNRIRAAVIGGGASDLTVDAMARPEMETDVYAQLIPDYSRTKDIALQARSAVYWPEKLPKTTPLLLLHGSADWRVKPAIALAMATRLYEVKHPFRFVFFEGGDHSLTEHSAEVMRLSKAFLDDYVRDRKPYPPLEPHGR